jgi:DNA polymerase III subunit chi
VTLYFAETTVAEQRELICQWAERLFTENTRVQIVVDSTAAAQFIDQLLWTFSQSSFIPHLIYGAEKEDLIEPVVITIGEIRLAGFSALLCDMPVDFEFMAGFETVVHFVLRDDAEKRQESRLLWQRARDMNMNPVHISYKQQPE